MSEKIKCPKCKTEDMLTINFQGVEVERCQKCDGIWFDMLEQEDLKKIKKSEKIDKGAVKAKPSSRSQQLECPKCHTKMESLRIPDQPHIVVEKCHVCYGVFFDAGEFTDFKKKSFVEHIKDIFK